MELAVIFFITVMGLGNEIHKSNDKIELLEYQVKLQEKWIIDLENWSADQELMNEAQDENMEQQYLMALKLAGAHSAFYAGQQLKNNEVSMQIEQILRDLEKEDH